MDNLNCVTHLRGIMAIMRTKVDLWQQRAAGVELLILSTDAHQGAFRGFQHSSAEASTKGVNGSEGGSLRAGPFRPTTLPFNEMVTIFSKVASLWKKATVALQPQEIRFETLLRPLRDEAVALRSELSV